MRSFWNNLPIQKKLFIVFGGMALLVLIELLTLRLAMQNLSAVRAFVAGEGQWAKAQKEAIFRLQRYANTGDEVHLIRFNEALRVIDGDHRARLELQKPRPDMVVVRNGFIAGDIHPDDIELMVNLLRRFSSISYIKEAVETWDRGDRLITTLRELAADYHRTISSPGATKKDLDQLGRRLEVLNAQLLEAGNNFSGVLSEGSRWMENLILTSLLLLIITVESIILILTFLMGRDISQRIGQLVKVADHIGAGSFSERLEVNSSDEIGRLQLAVNKMGTLLDSSYRDLEDKIQKRTHELKAVAQIQNEFISIASHELRTPIMSLGMQIEIIHRRLRDASGEEELRIREQLGKAIRIHRRLSALLDVLIDLTKINTGKMDIAPVASDLSQVVGEVMKEISPMAQDAKVLLQEDIEANVCGVFDPIRMGQVVANLINNAVKYGAGSPVTVRLRKEGATAILSVTDQGPGIPDGLRDKIFERFERGSGELAIGGLGLGLFIGREIVVNHGGDIQVKSIPGVETTFTIQIPLETTDA